MPAELTRIISDIHYGDRSSRVLRLEQLRPLAEGATTLIINGDALDTRSGPAPDFTEACRAEVTEFFGGLGPPVRFLSGNHDPDFSPHHALDLAGGRVFLTHGDIAFDEIVPWGRDARVIRERVLARLGPPGARGPLADQLAAFRQIAASLPQRHQSERNGWKYLARLAFDVVWPPWRVNRIFMAWQGHSGRIRELARQHRPRAEFVLVGHTHFPGIWRSQPGPVVINTGSFCQPLGGLVVDLTPDSLTVRERPFRGGEFRLGEALAQFPLTP